MTDQPCRNRRNRQRSPAPWNEGLLLLPIGEAASFVLRQRIPPASPRLDQAKPPPDHFKPPSLFARQDSSDMPSVDVSTTIPKIARTEKTAFTRSIASPSIAETSTSTPSTLSTNWAKMRRAGIRAIQKRFVGHPRFPVYSKHANHLSNKALKTALATREATAAATASFQAAKSSFGSLSASVRLSLKIAHVLENEVHLRVARIDGPRIALHGFMIGRDLLFKRLYPVLVQNMFRTFAHNPPFPRGSAASESHSRQA